MNSIEIRPSDPSSPEARALLQAHLDMTSQTGGDPEACHAIGVDALQSPAITFFLAYHQGEAVGCGALKTLNAAQLEVKSVHVAASARGKGIAKQLMSALHEHAKTRGASEVLLETGSTGLPAFDAARALYASLGYETCAPFADYPAHPDSAFLRYSFK